MIEYTVKVYDDGGKQWFLNGERHREDGPAIEYSEGTKSWYLNNEELTEEEYNNKMNPPSCNGKLVTIDGKQYKLTEVR